MKLDGDALSFRGRVPFDYSYGAGPIVPDNLEHTISYQQVPIVDTVVIQTEVDDNLWSDNPFNRYLTRTEGVWISYRCLYPGRKAVHCYASHGTGSLITYTFEGACVFEPRLVVQFSEHDTDVLRTIGDTITVWEAVESVNSIYTVSIDGSELQSYYPPSNVSPEPIVALAHASNLVPGRHTITVRRLPKDGRSRIEITELESLDVTVAKWLKPTSNAQYVSFVSS